MSASNTERDDPEFSVMTDHGPVPPNYFSGLSNFPGFAVNRSHLAESISTFNTHYPLVMPTFMLWAKEISYPSMLSAHVLVKYPVNYRTFSLFTCSQYPV